MRFLLAFLPAAFSALAVATPLTSKSTNYTLNQKIQWRSCGLTSTDALNNTAPVLCGTLSVPLDYTDTSSNKSVQLDLLKVPAVGNSSKGTILTNDGGPGINNTLFMIGYGTQLRTITGGDHDIVSWHPRGTNGSLLFSCFEDASARQSAYLQFPSLSGTINGNSSDTALGQVWAETHLFAEACYAAQNATGDLIGTSFTARDMMQIVDALQEDGLLRYWGFSYGTLLGATAAAMFPERIDKLVLDGVVNALEYYTNPAVLLPQSADGAFTGFIKGCVADPSRCPLAKNHTAEELESFLYNFLDDLKSNPIIIESPPMLITYGTVKGFIASFLKDASSWVKFSKVLNALVTSDSAYLVEYFKIASTSPPESDADANQGIRCSDLSTRYTSLDDLRPSLQKIRNSSRILGDTNDLIDAQCSQWKFAAKERYTGDFQVKTSKPALFIGNTYDPATPLSSARNVSSGFEGSVVLEQDGFGHCSPSQASLCTAKVVRAYFANGTLPQPNTVCQVDQDPLPETPKAGWAKVLKQLS